MKKATYSGSYTFRTGMDTSPHISRHMILANRAMCQGYPPARFYLGRIDCAAKEPTQAS